MSNTILPDDLKHKIRALAADGYSTVAIFDSVFTEADQYVGSPEQLTRCISSLTAQSVAKASDQSTTAAAKHLLPDIKQFDAQKHAPVIDSLREEMLPLEFEQACEKLL
ncbi:MAG: hypothetical protein R6U29_12485 [Desulfosudaceae bacterium]